MTREKAIIDLNALKFILDNDQYTDEIEEALDTAISALQQPERKKGRWLNIDESEKWECSECGRMMWFSSRLSVKPSDYSFCPNCGADMREGEA